jgi:hemoglobin
VEQPVDPVGWIVPELGEAPLRALVAAFYQRVPGDDLLGPMYPAEDLAGAERRLADFLVERCGGPPCYSEQRGHPRLRMRHLGFPVDRAARDRWMGLMDAALGEVGLPEPAGSALRTFLDGVATFLINR